jgi:hypothetical protein
VTSPGGELAFGSGGGEATLVTSLLPVELVIGEVVDVVPPVVIDCVEPEELGVVVALDAEASVPPVGGGGMDPEPVVVVPVVPALPLDVVDVVDWPVELEVVTVLVADELVVLLASVVVVGELKVDPLDVVELIELDVLGGVTAAACVLSVVEIAPVDEPEPLVDLVGAEASVPAAGEIVGVDDPAAALAPVAAGAVIVAPWPLLTAVVAPPGGTLAFGSAGASVGSVASGGTYPGSVD